MSKVKAGDYGTWPDIAPERIDWLHVKMLMVMAAKNHSGEYTFWPAVVWDTGTTSRIAKTDDAPSARRTCARLSAIHDIPVRDWTRPAPDNLARRSNLWDLDKAGLLNPDLKESAPEQEPQWGAGWNETDWLFADGTTDEEFCGQMSELAQSLRDYSAKEEAIRPDMIEPVIKGLIDEAYDRWALLHAANTKPQPKPETV